MRPWFSALAILPCLALPALAQSAPSPHPRVTSEQRFTQANAAHDGHLTLEQAKAGYPSVARHFTEIDAGSKGFVTQDDIRAWHKQMRAAHRVPVDGKLKPRHAFQHMPASVNASTAETVLQPATHTVGPDLPVREAGGDGPG